MSTSRETPCIQCGLLHKEKQKARIIEVDDTTRRRANTRGTKIKKEERERKIIQKKVHEKRNKIKLQKVGKIKINNRTSLRRQLKRENESDGMSETE
jgi:hypothetical protein